MLIAVILLTILLVASLATIALISVVTLRYAKMLTAYEESVNKALDILDDSHRTIHNILEKPVFFDNEEIKLAIHSIKRCKNAILYVANQLTYAEELAEEAEKLRNDEEEEAKDSEMMETSVR